VRGAARGALPPLALFASLAVLAARAEAPELAAQAAAGTWLALVDGGNYYQSWATAAQRVRNEVSRTQWVQRVSQLRDPLGALRSRQVISATPAHSLPGAADGDSVVIRYQSRFEHQASAIETVTPMKDTDGRWRVSGYSIR
jgi:hypothetical protein